MSVKVFRLKEGEVYYTPTEHRDLILKVLENIKFNGYNDERVTVGSYMLVIFNDIEYVVKVTSYNEDDDRINYNEMRHSIGYYDFEFVDEFKLSVDVVSSTINKMITNKVMIDLVQLSFIDKLLRKIFDYNTVLVDISCSAAYISISYRKAIKL